MHGLILSLKSKNVLGALAPSLPVRRVDVSENMRNTLLEVLNGIAIGVKVTGTIPLPVEVVRSFQGVVAVDGDEKLDTIAVCLHHEDVEAVQHSIIPVTWVTALEAVEGVDWGSLDSSRLAYLNS